jgi:alkylated DNA repair dioxygenase AlkB
MSHIIEFEELPGLFLIPNVFSNHDAEKYFNILNDDTSNICKQIHSATEYGWKFLPPTEQKTIDDYLGKFPDWLIEIWHIIYEQIKDIDILPKIILPDHILINKYEIEDGCKIHTDDLVFWDNFVIGASFGSGTTMEFIKTDNSKKINVWIPPNSVYIMIDEARYHWSHSIPFVKEDIVYGSIIPRSKRISLTFRNISEKFLSNDLKDSCNKTI